MRNRITLNRTGVYILLIVIVILLLLLLGGRRWITGPMHGHGNVGGNQMEMESNPE